MEPSGLPKNLLTLRTKTFNLIKERSFSRGKVVLSSGKESDYYLDLKPTMLHGEGIELLCTLIFEKLKKLPVDYFGGLEIGAVPLLSPLAMIAFDKGRQIPGFFVRKTVKTHGTKKLIEGVLEGELHDKRVVILDDVTTLGGSALKAVNAVKEVGAKVVLVLSIVDREEGAAELFKAHNVPFEALFRASEFMRATEPPAS